MQIKDIIFLPAFVDKLDWKHQVQPHEVAEVLFRQPFYRKVQNGQVPGEDVFAAMGKTESGRYLIVFLIYKLSREALIISARDMDRKERRQYEKRR
jgi:uncharacterized DUF497 family protein